MGQSCNQLPLRICCHKVVVGDMDKYRAIIAKVKDAAISIDLAVDNFPDEHPHKLNPRYKREMLDKDVMNEDSHMAKLEELMSEQVELQACMSEVESDLDSDGGLDGEGVTAESLTGTQTHQQLIAAFNNLSTDKTHQQQLDVGSGQVTPSVTSEDVGPEESTIVSWQPV